ncbi:hypothetical protein RHMOL_Rhmol11G0214900 [Rhododendron molle]|uniref:Uncharacterized protein n=1 Tax=Rhododendron molle TaxID=49168 RepID=A0ACC0LV25_RHOML|nr:hypothetical protein RHMOL_Rhmol11G0214900 [Rhododendron molle]
MDHFLLHCPPFQWVLPPSLDALLQLWMGWLVDGWKLKPILKMIWECIPFAILRSLWIKRNGFIFENENRNWDEVELIKL